MDYFSERSRRKLGYVSSQVPITEDPYDLPLIISGGQETVTVGGYKYVVFTSSGTLSVSNSGNVSVLSIGGGGGGGSQIGGGGGGGEIDNFVTCSVNANVTVTIGTGGSAVNNVVGVSGGTTTFGALVSSLGGGCGSGYDRAPVAGGSGGGGGGGSSASTFNPGGTASGSNTFAGGQGFASSNAADTSGGGGGGASAVGTDSSNVGKDAGNGGLGLSLTTLDSNLTAANFPTSLTGMTVVSSGGGGGTLSANSPYNATRGLGGTGAGNGAENDNTTNTFTATSATSYGSGGGGGGWSNGSPSNMLSGAGYQGIVIVRQAV